jgi:hypothetical protein
VIGSIDMNPADSPHQSSASALTDLQQRFRPLTFPLTPEIEPALVYKP